MGVSYDPSVKVVVKVRLPVAPLYTTGSCVSEPVLVPANTALVSPRIELSHSGLSTAREALIATSAAESPATIGTVSPPIVRVAWVSTVGALPCCVLTALTVTVLPAFIAKVIVALSSVAEVKTIVLATDPAAAE